MTPTNADLPPLFILKPSIIKQRRLKPSIVVLTTRLHVQDMLPIKSDGYNLFYLFFFLVINIFPSPSYTAVWWPGHISRPVLLSH